MRILPHDEAVVLARARGILVALSNDCLDAIGSAAQPQHLGRAAEACERAEDAIFHALNVLDSYVGDELARTFVLHRAGRKGDNEEG